MMRCYAFKIKVTAAVQRGGGLFCEDGNNILSIFCSTTILQYPISNCLDCLLFQSLTSVKMRADLFGRGSEGERQNFNHMKIYLALFFCT